MNKFEKDKDLNISEDGRAQDRIPGDLSLEALQQGTVINADMVNAWVFEIVNAIKKLGLTPDRTKENQLIEALNQKTIYNQVGQVNSWVCNSTYIPRTEAVLDGSMLYASNYEDGLAMLKKRCPNWRSGENIRLPDYRERFLRVNHTSIGTTQEDAMRAVTINVTSNARITGLPDIPITQLPTNYVRTKGSNTETEGSPELVYPGKTALGYYTTFRHSQPGAKAAASSAGAKDCNPTYYFEDLSKRKTYDIGDMSFKFTSKKLNHDGRKGKEFFPRNFAVIMTVVAGIPK